MRLTASVEPGSSGSPVLDEQGRVVGIVYAIEVATGLALAIPLDTLRTLVDRGGYQAIPACGSGVAAQTPYARASVSSSEVDLATTKQVQAATRHVNAGLELGVEHADDRRAAPATREHSSAQRRPRPRRRGGCSPGTGSRGRDRTARRARARASNITRPLGSDKWS